MNKKLNFFKTIRFKLTLLYSLIVFVFCGLLVLGLNLYIDKYFNSEPNFERTPDMVMINRFPGPNVLIHFNQLQEEEQAVVKAIRANDLAQIRAISIYALIPIALLSFALGYILSGRFLDPIHKLKNNIDKLTRTDLGKKIPVEIEDEVGGLIMSFNELSERLKNSFEVQERFVQDASHEIKTPLTIIQTNLDTVVDDPNATKDELNDSIANALKGVKELRKLTDYLLDLTVNQEVTLKETDLGKFVDEQIGSISQLAKSSDLNIETNIKDEKSKGILIEADDMFLGRAVFNLLENAIKYKDVSLKKGESFVSIDIKKDLKNAFLTIKDNGVGIPEAHQKKIFDRFFRVDKSRNKKTGGFGLGLAISKKIIEDHNGKIDVVSTKNNTVFTITLPLLKK